MKFVSLQSPFATLQLYGARAGDYSFIISYELQIKPEYRASWKDGKSDITPFGEQPSNFIDGSPFSTFDAAKEACKATYKQLRAKQ